MKLNIGAGRTQIEGFEARDGAQGDVIFPLPDAANSIDEIRASHVLEHFAHGQVHHVLQDWVRALKPGGVLRIAVPDFKAVAEQYLAGAEIPVQGYIMGGQTDVRDYHGSIFDAEMLTEAMRGAGLVGIRRWASELSDCAALPISLNLAGTKPHAVRPKIAAVMTLPRLGFNDFWGCALATLAPRGIQVTRFMGAYWHKGITKAIEDALQGDLDYILTLDYDTIFDGNSIDTLIDVALRHPEADAIAPLQSSRHHGKPLLFIRNPDGTPRVGIERSELDAELVPVTTAHFGLTLIRADKIRALPRPWFHAKPDADGRWEEGSVDPDIWFWHRWAEAGNTLMVAPRVPVGHAELLIRWPDQNLEATHQLPSEFNAGGPPENAWR